MEASLSEALESKQEGLWINSEKLTRSVWLAKVFSAICKDDSGFLSALVIRYYRGMKA